MESKVLCDNTSNFKYPVIDNMQVNTQNTPIDSKNKSDKKFYITLICIFIFSILCNTFCFQLAQVNGSSMYPTMKDGQLLVISKLANKDEYQRGDIIIFKAHGKKLIKRLIGLPGETIQIIDNDIYINGEKIKDYVDVDMEDYGVLNDKITLKEDEYFFLGDNRNNSSDCRIFGAIHKSDIIGKIIFRFIPTSTKF